MVQIIRASEMGFCMGVRRAVQIMESQATLENPIYSVGEIVHNPHVVASLEASGVRQLPGPDELEGNVGLATAQRVGQGRVAITAHGVGERVVRELAETGLEVVDTTCPIVTRAQRYAQKFVRDGWHVVIFGDPSHKEVRGIMGWTMDAAGNSRASIVEDAALDRVRAFVEGFPGGFPSKIGVMAQTTHKMDDFAKFVANIMLVQRDHNFELHVVNTLCHATTGQQEAAAALAHNVDVMVVVGGRKSANTRHLKEVCEELGTRAFQVECAEDLDPEWFTGAATIGLTAGASTPDYSIDQVEARLRQIVA
jgi:4-hydroxy-3-methylbut-2-enyl diphosphate reductase